MAEHLKQPKSLISVLFTVLILMGAALVLSPFLLALVWAGVIAIAFWPLHCRIHAYWPNRPNWSALCTTTAVALLLVGPMIALFILMFQDLLLLVEFFQQADAQGVPSPQWLQQVPVFGDVLNHAWKQYLSTPRQVSGLLREIISQPLGLVQQTASTVLLDLLGRIATLFFALWVLFFLYRDGAGISVRFNRIGTDWLSHRWKPYVSHVPPAVRAAINGLVIVSFGEAVVLSALFYACGLSAPVLLGTLTAVIAFIPGAAPALLGIVGAVLVASGHGVAGVVLIAVGVLVVFMADYLVRPLLIQGGTQLPFLAVLFGVFGGVITMGIVGLIVGPVLLVLLLVFFDEAAHAETFPGRGSIN